ncbi:ferritin-like domain-containing protein [Pelomicrobium methylotrophicum]|uniref:Ferritin-like domain-containing protein n=1 Tax=Pelomicrobium methylotrophicum TaxID=2602750 RepID=A0A5C7EWU7_9PROT|nr:ferritin-like domain-containing protein [Pelomicrobium methylotrophicum]TXF11710.1 ferritin-like domain-containing protein [Pelomicrobium methylotrophicum]
MSTSQRRILADHAASRRAFLHRAGVVSAGLLAWASARPLLAAGKAKMISKSEESDIAILNVALGLEHQAIAAYQVGAESGLLQKPVLEVALRFQADHKAHAGVLTETVRKLGGTPVEARQMADYGFPVDKLRTQADVLAFAAGLEQGAASAYLGAVPQFHNRDLAKAAASILGAETMHWAVLRNALGQDPVPAAFVS